MMRKFLFLFLTLFFLIIGCKKEQETEETNAFGEVIYSDSFAPNDWENPNARTKIEAEDKDIGKIIKENSLDQKYLKVLDIVKDFINSIQSKNSKEIQKILTPATFDLFNLRIPTIPADKKYTVRVALPEDVDAEKYWVEFKIMFTNTSVISKIEIQKNGNSFLISDIESKFFISI